MTDHYATPPAPNTGVDSGASNYRRGLQPNGAPMRYRGEEAASAGGKNPGTFLDCLLGNHLRLDRPGGHIDSVLRRSTRIPR